MPISNDQGRSVVLEIEPIFDQIKNVYDESLYPPAIYLQAREVFPTLALSPENIYDALRWKWGHWKKSNFSVAHKRLILDIQTQWEAFVDSDAARSPTLTFQWWTNHFRRRTTYITTSFLTHLVHHAIHPIIDQHNYRAMTHFIAQYDPGWIRKKRPSTFNDILALKDFIGQLHDQMPDRSPVEIDRFLMMYGRDHVSR